jgi:1,4-dihydroxy-2-naphthoate octaprenyltransferase
MIFGTMVPAIAIGLYLAWIYGLVFFLVGVFSVAVGIAYTYGPMPISRSPFGEVFSGFTMGAMMPLLLVIINIPEIIVLYFDGWQGTAMFDMEKLLSFGLMCAPIVLCISNIMLANNICDIEKDRSFRYTMPIHIGVKHSVRIFATLYVLAYGFIFVTSVFRIIPLLCLLVLLTAIPVFRRVSIFSKKQIKSETFVICIQNFMLILVPYGITMLLGSWVG